MHKTAKLGSLEKDFKPSNKEIVGKKWERVNIFVLSILISLKAFYIYCFKSVDNICVTVADEVARTYDTEK
jgi:hypothetical protein